MSIVCITHSVKSLIFIWVHLNLKDGFNVMGRGAFGNFEIKLKFNCDCYSRRNSKKDYLNDEILIIPSNFQSFRAWIKYNLVMPTYFLQLKLGHLFCNIYLLIFALNFQMCYWTSGLLEKVSEVSFDRLSATNYSWNLLTSFLDILHKVSGPYTPQNMKFSIFFFSKCDQILNAKLLFLYSGKKRSQNRLFWTFQVKSSH